MRNTLCKQGGQKQSVIKAGREELFRLQKVLCVFFCEMSPEIQESLGPPSFPGMTCSLASPKKSDTSFLYLSMSLFCLELLFVKLCTFCPQSEELSLPLEMYTLGRNWVIHVACFPASQLIQGHLVRLTGMAESHRNKAKKLKSLRNSIP